MRYRHHRRQADGQPRPELALAIVIGLVVYGLVIAWLFTTPLPPTGRVVSVDADGNATD